MVQGGDPLGTGKGGESIWGGPFPDEFHPDNKHDRRGMVRGTDNACLRVFDTLLSVFDRLLAGVFLEAFVLELRGMLFIPRGLQLWMCTAWCPFFFQGLQPLRGTTLKYYLLTMKARLPDVTELSQTSSNHISAGLASVSHDSPF